MERILIVCLVTACLIAIVRLSNGCNEAVCASVVSKCMLTQSCKCDLKDCSCCKECFSCLSYLYSECCSCVDMCPKPNETSNELYKKSYVAEFKDGVPGLFQALTSEPDQQERWLSFTFPVDFDISLFGAAREKEVKYHLQSMEQELEPVKHNVITLNCTVAYMSQCMSCNKCRVNCQSMGSTSFRWFHDGCCECIGDNCINYGINESRCLACPDHKDPGMKLDNDEENDYGEEMDPQSLDL